MARPVKTGLEYFPLDVNTDDKLELIEAEHGLQGFAIVIKLWQKIYSNGYFIEWNEDIELLFSRRINSEKTLINSVITSCFHRNLLDKSMYDKYGILTSAGIQRRFFNVCKQSKRSSVTAIEEYLLVFPEFTDIITELTRINPEISTQRKEKKSKVKESKEKCVETPTQKIMTFHEKLSLFKTEYLSSGRFEKTCMTLNIRPDVLKKYFDEFTDAQECGSKHEGIVNYAEFSSQMSSHFFNTVKFMLKKENESKPKNGFNDTLNELLILNSD